ncbi:MAG: pyrophosphohydrolase domain-containing protein [Methanobacterium sp.]
MSNIFKYQLDFIEQSGQSGKDLKSLYAALIHEESVEFENAWDDEPLVNCIKEACDVIYVAAGFINSVLGDNAIHAWDAVHESNMAKVTGNVEVREDGKILKNDEFKKIAKQKLMTRLEELVNQCTN